jgi:CheY-like chemotaxis protein
VLIADDNVDAALSLAEMLAVMGHEVVTVHDGLAAVESAGAFRPEVILLDIGMPRLNGYEAARRIREQVGGQKALLVALTGWGHEDDKRRAEEAGFDRHFTKPVAPDALEKLLADVL